MTTLNPVSNLPIAVIDDDPKTRARMAMQIGDERATALASLDALEQRFPPGTAMVAVFGPAASAGLGMDAIGAFSSRRPEAATVVVVEELTTAMLQQALRAGVRDVLPAPVDGDQLADAVERVASALRPASTVPEGSGSTVGGAKKGRIITVFSTKGGAGKSVIASNLAVSLKRRVGNGDVALVDADLQFGDIAVMLKLTPQHTIVDAVNAGERIDEYLLRNLVTEHRASGVLVLAAPIEPAFADQVGSGDMARIIDALRGFCDYVVIDTPAYFNDVVLSLIENSDEIVLVAGMDIPNIKNVKIGLQTLRLLNVPMSKLKLVLNRANSKVKLDVAEVERTLQVKADSLLPSEIAVPQSVNKGVPAVIDAPKSPVARALEKFADLIHESSRTGGAQGQ